MQIPLARKCGWPTYIDWAALSQRVYALQEWLQRIVDDVDEDFLPGNERIVEVDTPEEDDAKDDVKLLATRPRKGSAFWREVVRSVRRTGSMRATGVGGQMATFSKTQPG